MADTTIKGLRELQAALDQLPAKVEANIMRSALRAGAKVLKAEVQATTAFMDRTGKLRDAVRITTRLAKGTAQASVVLGPKKGDKHAFYGPFLEFGTKAHEIKSPEGKAMPLGLSMAKTVHHPGIRPRPFMRPAVDHAGPAAVQATADYIRQRLASKHGIDVPAPLEEGDE